PDSLKKADLISYWLESYTNYIDFETTFDSSRLPRYKRGSVLRVNFGFNIGKELGGLHLAVVLDNDNKRNADVITVIPLSSTDGKAVHPRNVDLQTEVYTTIHSHLLAMSDEIKARNTYLKNLADQHYKLIHTGLTPQQVAELEPIVIQTNEEIKEVDASLDILQKHIEEITHMKRGSMALVNQITTISKQRIYIPKKSSDFLYGITLSEEAMDKINAKIKELYFFE
ncbi:MAG: type II toxin-antitoxin system PemK/MazF family toxin, partial [Bacteroidales bacterium]|nr:type II toxin-antitoxin system PemK/MazF family toxin [Bacteroidales bacterium]